MAMERLENLSDEVTEGRSSVRVDEDQISSSCTLSQGSTTLYLTEAESKDRLCPTEEGVETNVGPWRSSGYEWYH